MFQRIQSVYFILSALLFIALLGGLDFLKFHESTMEYHSIDLYGRSSFYYSKGSFQLISHEFIPLVVLALGMILLLFSTLVSYKKIKRQLSLARLTFLVNAFLVVVFVIWSTILFVQETANASNNVQVGFYLAVVTLPLTFFGYKGVLRDKTLLDSINRLR
jgi:amino acid transporter